MLDILRDIIRHTKPLGDVETIKITGTHSETLIESVNFEAGLILKARLKTPSDELVGTFGMTDLAVLSGYLDFPSFKADGAKVQMTRRARNGEEVPVSIVFNDPQGQSFTYRLMSKEIVKGQPPIPDTQWAVSFAPQKTKIDEFRKLASILSPIHKEFLPKTVGGDLRFYIGGENTGTHDGFVVFEPSVTGGLSGTTVWPIGTFLNVMKLVDQMSSNVQISASGLMTFDFASDLAFYTYIIGGRAITK